MFSATQLAAQPQLGKIDVVFPYQGSLWLGCDTALCEIDGAGQIHRHGLDDGVPADSWSGMLVDRQGTLWLRGVHHVLARPAGATGFIARDVPDDDMDVQTTNGTFVEDPDGRVLTRTNRGLARWNGTGWDVFDHRNGLPDIGITASLFDRSGTLWLGTYGHGIYRWSNYGLVENWGRDQGLDSVPSWSIVRDDQERMWFGNELGGSVLARGQTRLQPWPMRFSPPPRQVYELAKASNGAIWAGLSDGRILRYDPASDRTTLAARLPSSIRKIYFDRQGRLWIGTANGIYHIDPLGGAAQRVSAAQSTDSRCSDIAEDSQGTLWFACDAGMLRYAHGRWTLMAASAVSKGPGFAVVAIATDDSLWLGVNEPGVFQAKIVNDQLIVVTTDDLRLQNSLVYFMRRDRRGWIWVGSSTGVDVFNGKSWTHLSQDDGLIWDETDQDAFVEDHDGSIWIGTPIGISHILQPEAMLSTSLRTVMITAVTDGTERIGDGGIVRTDGNREPLIVRYALLGRVSGNAPHFRYRLQGLGWIETASHIINFTGLPPGDYRFEVQAIDDDRRSTSPSSYFNFSIPTPWWLSWWTYPLEALLVVLVLAFVWRWRSRRLRRQNRRLESMVAMRTAELYDQATHDGLTGLYNRMAILDLLAKYLEPDARASPGLAVAMIDADHFKRVNDTFGHQAGDATLQAIADHLKSHIRGGDQLGRYGGEEILMVLPGIGSLDAENRMQQIQQAVSAIIHGWRDDQFRVTLSIGLAWVGHKPITVEEVIRRADSALYVAKTGGRNRVISEMIGV